jgi:serine phosphatase RsbU (regulator of sigma subunit)
LPWRWRHNDHDQEAYEVKERLRNKNSASIRDGKNTLINADVAGKGVPAGLLAGHKPDQAEVFISELMTETKKFTGDAPQNDDITAIYLLRN